MKSVITWQPITKPAIMLLAIILLAIVLLTGCGSANSATANVGSANSGSADAGTQGDDLQNTGDDALEHIVLVIRIVSIFLFDKFIQIRQIDLKSEIRLIIAAVRKHERHDKMHGITVF